METLDPLIIAYVAAVFCLGGFVKGAIGLGLPVVALPALALIMPLPAAMAIFLAPGVASNLLQVSDGPHLPALARRLWPFLLAAVIGILIGVRLLAGFGSDVMVGVLGVLLMLYSAVAIAAPRFPEPGPRERWLSPLAGAGGGVVFGMTGIFIVPGLLYLETLRMPRDQFVQALGLTFVTITATLALTMTSQDMVTAELAVLSAACVAPVFLGMRLGARLRQRISEAFYRKVFFVALMVSGLYMLGKATL